MRRLALRQFLQPFDVTADERLLLGTTPFLQLALVLNCICNSIEPLRKNQIHRSSRCRVALESSCIVLGYRDLERPSSGPDVVAPVRTSENVEPRSVTHCRSRPMLRDGEDAASQDEANRYRVNSMNKCAGLRETKMAPKRRHFVFRVVFGDPVTRACGPHCRRGGPSAARSPWCRR